MKGSVSQNKENGMYLAVVYHDDSDISAITCKLPREYHQFFDQHGLQDSDIIWFGGEGNNKERKS